MVAKSGFAAFCQMATDLGTRVGSRFGIGMLLGFACGLIAAPVSARAQGALVLYCSVEEEWCRAMTTSFERQTGIKVAMTRKSSGETYAQLKAEAANPRG